MKGDSPDGAPRRRGLVARLWRLFWLLVLVGHAVAAFFWLWLEPGGFGVLHPRFWVNRVAPAVGLCVTLAAVVALRIESALALRWFLPLWPAFWGAAAVAGRILFPVSLARWWLLPLAVAAIMALAVVRPLRGARGLPVVFELGPFLVAALTGAGLVWAQCPPPGATQPLDLPLTDIDAKTAGTQSAGSGGIILDPNVMVQASDGSINTRVGTLSIAIQPLLVFLNGSADGCWTIFAQPEDRAGPQPRLLAAYRHGERSCAMRYDFARQGPAALQVGSDRETGAIAIEARSQLDRPIFSHLNSFCDFEVRGHHRLALEFSPCPGTPIEVRAFDYPFGRPSRFAFLDAHQIFRVVEATSGEKGPFHTLAAGPLGRNQELAIVLLDEGRPLARIVLADWPAQVDTTLSPTAGWGVPVNAIEFSLSGDSPRSPASIFVTLAGTSVGRGWDCVAHRAGTYRNRIRLESAMVVDSRMPARSLSPNVIEAQMIR